MQHLNLYVNRSSTVMCRITLFYVLAEYESVAVISISEYQSADPLQAILPPPAILRYLHLLNPSSFISLRPMREPVVYHEKEKSYLKRGGAYSQGRSLP